MYKRDTTYKKQYIYVSGTSDVDINLTSLGIDSQCSKARIIEGTY